MTVINSIVAKQLIDFKRDVDAEIKKIKKDEGNFRILKNTR